MGGPVTRITDLGGDVKRVKLWSLLWFVSPRTRYGRRCQEAILDLCISSGHLALGVLGGQLGSRLLDAWGLIGGRWFNLAQVGSWGGRWAAYLTILRGCHPLLKNFVPCNLIFGCIVIW